MKKKILVVFQICISVPLTFSLRVPLWFTFSSCFHVYTKQEKVRIILTVFYQHIKLISSKWSISSPSKHQKTIIQKHSSGGVLQKRCRKNFFAKFTRKHLCQSLFFNNSRWLLLIIFFMFSKEMKRKGQPKISLSKEFHCQTKVSKQSAGSVVLKTSQENACVRVSFLITLRSSSKQLY